MDSKSPCTLCAMVRGESSRDLIFGEGDVAIAYLSDDWAVKGHAIVASKRHVENVSDLNAREAEEFFRFFHFTETTILEATKADRAVLLKLGLLVAHLHIHIYPVSRELDRRGVLQVIDTKTRYPNASEEEDTFLTELRSAYAARR